jgi:hypothetical protein
MLCCARQRQYRGRVEDHQIVELDPGIRQGAPANLGACERDVANRDERRSSKMEVFELTEEALVIAVVIAVVEDRSLLPSDGWKETRSRRWPSRPNGRDLSGEHGA